jgi:hypothetical protein
MKFAWVRRHRGLTHVQRNVLHELNERANGEDCCWPSINRLASDIEATRRSVIMAMQELVDRKLIAVITGPDREDILRRAGVPTNVKVNVYRVLYAQPAVAACASPDSEHYASAPPQDGELSAPISHLDGETISPRMVQSVHLDGATISPEMVQPLHPNYPYEVSSESSKEKEQGSLRSPRTRARGTVSDADDLREVVAAWNTMAQETGLAPVRSLTKDRRSRLKQRLREHSVGEIVRAIGKVGRSGFCHGAGTSRWVADFDWLLKPESMRRALDGNYDRTWGKQAEQEKFHQIDAVIAAMQQEWERREAIAA